MKTFQNWSKDVIVTPQQWVYPATESEIVTLVKSAKAAGTRIRVAGSGHSFMPLVYSEETLISLVHHSGLVSVDVEKKQATVKSGTPINQLGDLLHEYGLGLENQGDIDVQAIAGAVSTGTHGSGVTLGSLATQVIEMRIILANGEILTCSETENREVFKAAQVSMGMIGIISTLTLQLVSAYKLLATSEISTISHCLGRLSELKTHNRNFEFYFFPHSETVQIKNMNTTTDNPDAYGLGNYLNDVVMENMVFQLVSTVSKHIAATTIPLAKLTAKAVSGATRKCWSHQAYPTPRWVRFHEMEYNIPAEHFETVITAIKDLISSRQIRTHFPIECRFVRQDDIWLSPAYQRESAYIAVHQYQGMEYKSYFGAVEEIFQAYGGRPHWGKINTCERDYLAKVYPQWDNFQAIRKQYDPNNCWLNPYLARVFG